MATGQPPTHIQLPQSPQQDVDDKSGILSPSIASPAFSDAFAATGQRLAPAPTPQNTYPTAGSEGTPTFHTVPYPTVHAYPVASTPMAVASSGPVSGSIQVPARPKPGRKAATDEPENKRKAQNRQAQRAFRDRKQQQAETLDKTNQELREMNEKLRTEFRAIQAKFEKNQQELQREHDAAIQRAKDFENKFQNSIPMLNELHAKVEALQMELREAYIKNALSLPQNGPVTGSAVGAPTTEGIQPTFGSTTQGYTGEQRGAVLSGVPQKRHIATDGCGDCEENGACACVDSYVVEVPQPILRAQDSALSRQLSTSSMSIHSLLSPDAASSGQGESDVPELVNDHSSPEELETEFTYVSVGRDATQSCGFCGTDRSNCLCADTAAAKGDRPTLASYGSGPAQTLMGPPKIKPGSCVECQQNPEQKAYCEQLAQEREQDRAQPDGQPAAKRPRSNRNNPSVPCASAFQLYKHYSGSGNNRTPSYDEIYQDLTASNPGSQRGTGIQGMERHRQFSAFETDIATVIANLRHHDSSSASSQSMNRVDNADNSNPSNRILMPKPRYDSVSKLEDMAAHCRRLSSAPSLTRSGSSSITSHNDPVPIAMTQNASQLQQFSFQPHQLPMHWPTLYYQPDAGYFSNTYNFNPNIAYGWEGQIPPTAGQLLPNQESLGSNKRKAGESVDQSGNIPPHGQF